MLEAINNRELGFMEILTIALDLFKKNFKAILIVVAVLFFPISILHVLIMEKLSNSALILLEFIKTESALENMSFYTQVLIEFLENHVLQMTVLLFLEPIGVITIAKIAKGHLCNENVSVGHAIGDAMNCLWGVIITGISYWILVFIGSFFFVIPGLYLGVIWTFYVYVIGLRGIKGWKALVYSKKLTNGKFWKTVGFILFTTLIVSGCGWCLNALFFLAPENIATNILNLTLTYIFNSFVFIGMTVLFMNREAIMFGKKYYPTESIIDSTIVDDEN